jgi:hypothetical protein
VLPLPIADRIREYQDRSELYLSVNGHPFCKTITNSSKDISPQQRLQFFQPTRARLRLLLQPTHWHVFRNDCSLLIFNHLHR